MENTKAGGIDEREDREEERAEETEDEEKKMEMFFALIRNYQEARKRGREEKSGFSGDEMLNPKKRAARSEGGERSGIVPAFRPEDFSLDVDLKRRTLVFPAKDEEKKTEEEGDEEKEGGEEGGLGLDLNLAL